MHFTETYHQLCRRYVFFRTDQHPALVCQCPAASSRNIFYRNIFYFSYWFLMLLDCNGCCTCKMYMQKLKWFVRGVCCCLLWWCCHWDRRYNCVPNFYLSSAIKRCCGKCNWQASACLLLAQPISSHTDDDVPCRNARAPAVLETLLACTVPFSALCQ